jgi:aspartyl-tRNA(Asn)/glutamyl-tRNA(Gln) amidotransferase subunit B
MTSGFNGEKSSGIDLNRAGTPLLEIVTEPDIRSSKPKRPSTRARLHTLVVWLGICDGNMQEGSFRCDVNVSVRRPACALGTRREIKNLNSFKHIVQATDYEINWQIDEIEDGRAIRAGHHLVQPGHGRDARDAHQGRRA